MAKSKTRKRESAQDLKDQALQLLQHGNPAAAGDLLEHALAKLPNSVEIKHFLGLAKHQAGDNAAALPLMEDSLAAAPQNPAFNANAAAVLLALDDLDRAESCCRAALAVDANSVGAHVNLANVYEQREDFDAAISEYEVALRLNPNLADAWCNMGTARQKQNRVDDAIALYRKAIALAPQHVMAHWNLSQALLLKGDFGNGWREQEWRLKKPMFAWLQPLSYPKLDGSESVLIRTEQGLGDLIQMLRFAPRLRERCRKLSLQCPHSLRRLLASVPGVDDLVAGQDPAAAERADAQLPVMSLPFVLGCNDARDLRTEPYLQVDEAEVENWRLRLPSGFRVGLVWGGSPSHRNDRNRSIPFAQLERVLDAAPGCFVSLQKGQQAKDCADAVQAGKMLDFTDELADFADTAALASALDLVITVDTSVAHVCGALGLPTWVLIPFAPDWRWMLDRRSCLWYRSLRLFRQPAFRDWDSAIDDLISVLKERIEAS